VNRRTFIKTSAVGAAAAIVSHPASNARMLGVTFEPDEELKGKGLSIRDGLKILKEHEKDNTRPALRDEILENPGAVFIIDAGVKSERDENGIWKQCNFQMQYLGQHVASQIFRKGPEKGGRTFVKPNLVRGLKKAGDPYINGYVVHPYFIAGFADALRDSGNTAVATATRGTLHHEHLVQSGVHDLFCEHNLPHIEAHVQYFEDYHRSELNWHENPEGLVMRRFPTYRPAYDKDTDFINIAHAHTHPLGFTTLTIKNLQGIMPRGYGHICDDWVNLDRWRRKFMKNFNPDFRSAIERSYVKHAGMGYKYWDEGGYYRAYTSAGGYREFLKNRETANQKIFWHEQWAQRMFDAVEVMPQPYVNIVEGVFGQGDEGIHHSDFVTVGRNTVAVDSVTSWLMGHDPRELPYLRIAKERGLGENDIERIPLFKLTALGPVRVKDYRTLKRTPMGVYIYGLKENGLKFF